MGNSTSEDSSLIQSRGVIDIIYSTTSGTSKAAADDLQALLEDNKYLAQITNIGDYSHEDLIGHKGIIIFLLSTYGDGSAPSDGENFLEWIQQLQDQQQFSQTQYAIMAFGNSSFDNHCGFGLRTQKILKKLGGKELMQLTKCDSGSPERNVQTRFPEWSQALIEKLNASNPIKEISRSALGNPYHVTLEQKNNFNWESSISGRTNIAKEFMNYWQMAKCKVIHVRQLRKNTKDKRSTLWIRLQVNQDMHMHLIPACNIDVFPINFLDNDPQDKSIVTFNEVKGKVPFPAMPLRQIRKLLDYRQKATNKQIKNAILLSTCDESVVKEYSSKLKAKETLDITVKKMMQDLKPKLQFLPGINMNRVRTYTLSSWDPQKKYVDLVVSLLPEGLTSNYFKSYPSYIRIKPVVSSFYIPEDRPVIMIANGSGIAPFRSITQYYSTLPEQQRPKLRLYFGIQSQQVDFFFGEEWKAFEKQKLIELRIAESRKDQNKKVYVQNLLEEDVEYLHQHLFKENGVIFICGGSMMAREVGNVIFKAITIEVKLPYKAFSVSAQLKQKKTIVEEVYG